MGLEPTTLYSYPVLFGLVVVWLGMLTLLAWAVESERIPTRWVRHPLVYALSLGVYATSWTYYGSVGFAATHGYQFLTIYLGPTLACLLIPVVWLPLLRLSREYQLSSIADVLSFRYQSQGTGQLVTLFLVVGMVPYLGLQFRAVVNAMEVLNQGEPPMAPGLGFCLLLILFSSLFGARHASATEHNPGLVAAMAIETAAKVFILLLIGAYVIWGRFGGWTELNQWLAQRPESLYRLYSPMNDGAWNSLLLLSCSAAFLLPRQFHMAFTENQDERALATAGWAFPVVMLLLNLAIVPILLAGQAFVTEGSPDQYVLRVTTGSGAGMPLLAFVGGVASATGMLIVSPLALSHMALNHLVLPVRFPRSPNLYRWLQRSRRVLVALMLLAGYGFYRVVSDRLGLAELGLISFVACAQLIPGVLGTLFWPRANRTGMLVGLSLGILVWWAVLILPLLETAQLLSLDLQLPRLLGAEDQSIWHFVTVWSLGLNSLGFVLGSLLTRASPEEEESARICVQRGGLPLQVRPTAGSVPRFEELLSSVLGPVVAKRELTRALEELSLSPLEKRPRQLRQLRDQLERNLSGLLGPMLARLVVHEDARQRAEDQLELVRNIQFFEDQLQGSRLKLHGVARELDRIRRFHRHVLQELPMGICTIAGDGTVLFWNRRMEMLSQLSEDQVGGLSLEQLPAPWGPFLAAFAASETTHLYKQPLEISHRTRWFNLSKARLETQQTSRTETGVEGRGGEGRGGDGRAMGLSGGPSSALMTLDATTQVPESQGLVLLLEDLTEQRQLEQQLTHSERLASIGRLAAGVGHEIGNPLTGIACMVQNMQAEARTEDDTERLTLMLQEIMRIRDILQALARFAHRGEERVGQTSDASLTPVDVRAVVTEARRLVELTRRAHRVRVINQCPEGLQFMGVHAPWVQVFVNLLTNACDASPPDAEVQVLAYREGDCVVMEVLDEGSGIAPELQEQVFEPFVTTKAPGEGTGLGLSIVYHIVQAQGGTISLNRRPVQGTQALILLPHRLLSPPREIDG